MFSGASAGRVQAGLSGWPTRQPPPKVKVKLPLPPVLSLLPSRLTPPEQEPMETQVEHCRGRWELLLESKPSMREVASTPWPGWPACLDRCGFR